MGCSTGSTVGTFWGEDVGCWVIGDFVGEGSGIGLDIGPTAIQ